MTKIGLALFLATLAGVTISAGRTQSSAGVQALRGSLQESQEDKNQSETACKELIGYTALKEGLQNKTILVEKEPQGESYLVSVLLKASRDRGAKFVSTDEKALALLNGDSLFAYSQPPKNSWKLVVGAFKAPENLREPTGTNTYQATLFNEEGVEQGKWQGASLVDYKYIASVCKGTPNSSLWNYLQQPNKLSNELVKARAATAGPSGIANPKTLPSTELLTDQPEKNYISNTNCDVSVVEKPGSDFSIYRIHSGENDLELDLYRVKRWSSPAAFLCSPRGVTAVTTREAVLFDWTGDVKTRWGYTGLVSLSDKPQAFSITDLEGQDAVLTFKTVNNDVATQLTLPSWKELSFSTTSSQLRPRAY